MIIQLNEASEEANQITGLNHKIYLPRRVDIPNASVVIFVHGRAGNSNVMSVFTRVLPTDDILVVCPQAPLVDNIGGYSWWQVKDAESTSNKILQEAIKNFQTFIYGLKTYYGINLSRLYAVGFSQGAALIGSIALTFPGFFKGIALISGFIPKNIILEAGLRNALTLDKLEYSRQQTKCFISHGTKDQVVPFLEFEKTFKVLKEKFGEGAVESCSEEVGHKIGTSGMRSLAAWFKRLI